ncbi:MAG: hypothetical protein ACKVU4_14475, partial [Phycisphaerales bacterium]
MRNAPAPTSPPVPPRAARWDELGVPPPDAARANVARRGGRRPKPARRLPPEVLTDDEVRALMAACSPVALSG